MCRDIYPGTLSVSSYCVYYPSNIFRNTRGFENWGVFTHSPLPEWLALVRAN